MVASVPSGGKAYASTVSEHEVEALGWRAIDGDDDDELRALVEAAAVATGAPIALVSLLLPRIQLFRAQVGMPLDLALTRATDRCVSFCQVVVRDRKPLEIADALGDARVPQALVERYGIRAYYGVPLVVNDVVVGTLCVLDVQPRPFDNEAKANMGQLAAAAAARLSILTGADAIRPDAAAPTRRELTSAVAGVVAARIAAIELRPRLRALAAGQSGANALAVLGDASDAFGDIDRELATVETALRGLLRRTGPATT